MLNQNHRAWFAGGVGLALVAGLLGSGGPANAADALVVNDAELKAAIEALPAGAATITLDAGFAPVVAPPPITIPAGVDLTLTGSAGGTTVAKDPATPGRHLQLLGNGSQTVTLSNLKFAGANPEDPADAPGGIPGGGVGIDNVSTVTVSEAVFAGIDGSAGLALSGVATLDVSKSSFLGNRASSGSAIGLPSGIVAKITDTTIRKNWGTQAGYSGGALRLTGRTQLTVERTVFDGNSSSTRGGAIAFHQMDGTLTVLDSVFTGNTVPAGGSNLSLNDGGAIAVNERPITGPQTGKTFISGSTFDGNVAGDEGGALLLQSGNGSEAVIQNSTFMNNVSQGLQTGFEDSSGGGAIETFGTPLTLLNTTFVNNFAEKGNSFAQQRGGAVSATGDTAYLPVQPLTLSHNLFVGNDVGVAVGTPAPSSSYRQISARGGLETIVGVEDTSEIPMDSPDGPVYTPDDRELVYPPRNANPADGDESDFIPFVADVLDLNVGIDNGTPLPASINRLAVLGTDTPALGAHGSAIVAGDTRGAYAQTPGTLTFHPGDAPYLVGVADGIGPAPIGITADQRGFPLDVPADAGALQQAFIRYDPNGGNWEDYVAVPYNGERIVQLSDGAALVWAIGAVVSESQTEPEPTTAPADKTFVGWNTEPDGSGEAYPAGAITIPAGNLRLYAQWEEEEPPVDEGTVIAEYVDEDAAPLRAPVTHTGLVGDPYKTEQLEFADYDFVRVEGPTEGTYGVDAVTVRYHYAKREVPPVETGTVVASYVDTAGKALRAPITQSGEVGTKYATEQLSFSGYTFVRVDGTAAGNYGDVAVAVTYVYKSAGGTTPPTTPPTAPPTTPPTTAPSGGGLASTGFDLAWPLIAGGSAILVIAAGVLLYGRRRPGSY